MSAGIRVTCLNTTRARRHRVLLVTTVLLPVVSAVFVTTGAIASAGAVTYGAQHTLVGPALAAGTSVAVDAAGDLFLLETRAGRVVELPDGSTTPINLPFSGLTGSSGIAVDAAGDVFVADSGNAQVLELAHGSTTPAPLGFTGLGTPSGVAVDASGNVFVTDIENNDVVELPAGSSQVELPFTGLSDPESVAVDPLGDVFVTDSDNNQVLELANGSTVQTVLSFDALDLPFQVGVDASGDVFVADEIPTHGRVHPNQIVELATGAPEQIVLPLSPEAMFHGSRGGFAADASGDLFAPEGADGVYELANGSTTPTVLPFDGVSSPQWVAADAVGDAFITGGTPEGILEVPNGGDTPTSLLGDVDANGVAVDGSGDLFTIDEANTQVDELTPGSTSPTILPFSFSFPSSPQDVAVDAAGDVFVSDANGQILELPHGSTTQVVLPFSGLFNPVGVAADAAGDVFVADAGNNRIVELPAGTTNQIVLPFTDLSDPLGVAVDGAGDVFAGDSNQVVELSQGSTIQSVLPITGISPFGIAVDSNGDVFATDADHDLVVELPVETASGPPPQLPEASSVVVLPVLALSALGFTVAWRRRPWRIAKQ
jgi:streptogramin lyase